MMYQVVSFILQIGEGLLAGTCLLRCLFHLHRVSISPYSGNPLGPFVMSVTNWLVLPLRRGLPSVGRIDTASIVGAYLVVLVKTLILVLLFMSVPPLSWWFVKPLFDLIGLFLSSLNGLVLVYAVMTWISSDHSVKAVFGKLVNPMLRPIQKVLPLLGGIDLSPLALLALIQILMMVQQSTQDDIIHLLS